MQIIFFDVDGVLIHGYHTKPEKRRCWDKNLTTDFGIDRQCFKDEFINGPFLQVLVGKIDLKDSLSETLPKLGYYGDPQILIDYWLKNDSIVNHHLLDKIKLLKRNRNVKLYIATNQEHNRAAYLMNELGFSHYFEDIFYSAKMGVAKPNEEYFQKISEALDLSNCSTPILFDDSPEVINAAKKFGWEAYEYQEDNNEFICSLIDNIT